MRNCKHFMNFSENRFDFRPKPRFRDFETIIFFQPNNSGICMTTGGERPSYRRQAPMERARI